MIIRKYFLLIIFHLSGYTLLNSQNSIRVSGLSTTKAYFADIGFSKTLNKNFEIGLGVLYGRHHSLNIKGGGLTTNVLLYPHENEIINFFIASDIQFTLFNLSSDQDNIDIKYLHLVGGYGFDLKLSPNFFLFNYFGLGATYEHRSFNQNNIKNRNHFDTAGLFKLGMKYKI